MDEKKRQQITEDCLSTIFESIFHVEHELQSYLQEIKRLKESLVNITLYNVDRIEALNIRLRWREKFDSRDISSSGLRMLQPQYLEGILTILKSYDSVTFDIEKDERFAGHLERMKNAPDTHN